MKMTLFTNTFNKRVFVAHIFESRYILCQYVANASMRSIEERVYLFVCFE